MAYLFTADGMLKFWTLYQSSEGSNIYAFVKKMQEIFNVNERDATLIWQSFDVAEGSYLGIIKANQKPMKTKFQCSVCGKITSGRKPKSRNGKIYPRMHYDNNSVSCDGCYQEAIQVEVTE